MVLSCLRVLDQRFLQPRNEAVLILRYSLLHFSPSSWTILILYTHDAVNDFVNFPFVLTCNLYSSFLENMLNMPKIAVSPPRRAVGVVLMFFSRLNLYR